MEFTQADQDAITAAWDRIKAGETDFMRANSTDEVGIEAANGVLFVVVHDTHNSPAVAAALAFGETLGEARQQLDGVFSTTISISRR